MMASDDTSDDQSTHAIALCHALLDPEQYGHSVTPEVRDAAREVLGLERVETPLDRR